jgi:hypothetical protein
VPPDLSVLDGTKFVVYRDTNPNDGVFQTVEAARVWPAETTIAECTIAGGTAACSTGPLPTGSYRVHETVAPPGVPAGPDVNVTVSSGTRTTATTVTYVNTLPPLNLQLVKSGPDFAAVGTTFTYTFAATTTGPRLHAVSLVELAPDRCTTPLAGPTGDDGDLFLEVGETWRWTCTHTVTAGDPNPLLNTARVSGTDDYGRTVTTTDNHSVDTVLPGINLIKSGPATAHVGDTITYGFAVTNPGANAIVLRDVGVTDPRCATTPMRTGGDTNADNLFQDGETSTNN